MLKRLVGAVALTGSLAFAGYYGNQAFSKPEKYAVLILGNNEQRFQYDMSLMYRVLLESGFKSKHITVFDELGVEEYLYPSYSTATKKNIQIFFSELEKKVTEKDMVVVHISDHGDQVRSNGRTITTIQLPGDDMTEEELERCLSRITPAVGVLTTDICYGGALAKRIGRGKWIGVSASDSDRKAKSSTGLSFGGFFYLGFWHNQADGNLDGKVTISEAFHYARQRYPWTDECKPQLVSSLDVSEKTIK